MPGLGSIAFRSRAALARAGAKLPKESCMPCHSNTNGDFQSVGRGRHRAADRNRPPLASTLLFTGVILAHYTAWSPLAGPFKWLASRCSIVHTAQSHVLYSSMFLAQARPWPRSTPAAPAVPVVTIFSRARPRKQSLSGRGTLALAADETVFKEATRHRRA